MDSSDKKEILEAIGALAAHVDERLDGVDKRLGIVEVRLDGVDKRMGSFEDHLGSLAQEMRSGFADVNTRLDTLEENLAALSATFDKQLEDNVLGRDNITLSRHEYDVLIEAHDLPNKYATPSAAE